MTYFIGIDIGSRGSKGCIMEDGKIVNYFIGDTGPDSVATSRMVFEEVTKPVAQNIRDLENDVYVVATGYGRILVPFANENISEISCHAKGAHYCLPSVRTILDMGGQDCKAIGCDDNGVVTQFVMNDKCAGGTGRFLEIIASVLGVPLEEIGPLSLQSSENVPFTTVCAVFAKSEAFSMMKKGVSKENILAGLFQAIAERSYNLMRRIAIQRDFVITGGISKNIGLVTKIQEKVGLEPIPLEHDAQIAGALGAAIFAEERWTAKQAKEAAKAG